MSCWPCERLSSGSGQSLPEERTGPAVATSGPRSPPRGAVAPLAFRAGRRASSTTTLLLFKRTAAANATIAQAGIPAAASTAPRALSKLAIAPSPSVFMSRPPAGLHHTGYVLEVRPAELIHSVIPQARQQRGRIHRVAEHHNRHLRRRDMLPHCADGSAKNGQRLGRAFGPASHIAATLMLTRTSGRPSQRRSRPRSAVNSSESRQRDGVGSLKSCKTIEGGLRRETYRTAVGGDRGAD